MVDQDVTVRVILAINLIEVERAYRADGYVYLYR
jgi:hypothetical protein